MSNTENTPELNEEQIALYLRNHPGFFLSHEDLLSELELTKDDGNTVSLVERQVGILRERNVDMRTRLSNLIDNARKNDQLFEKTKVLILSLLECKTIDEVNQVFNRSLNNDFNLAFTSFVLFDLPANINNMNTKIVSTDKAYDAIPGIMRNGKAICGVLRKEELHFIFGEQGSSVGSAAVVPLNYKNQSGLIAVGSTDSEYFRSSMGTLFLNYIGEAISRIIHNLNN